MAEVSHKQTIARQIVSDYTIEIALFEEIRRRTLFSSMSYCVRHHYYLKRLQPLLLFLQA